MFQGKKYSIYMLIGLLAVNCSMSVYSHEAVPKKSVFKRIKTYVAQSLYLAKEEYLEKTPYPDIVAKFKLKHPEKLLFYRKNMGGIARVGFARGIYKVILPLEGMYSKEIEQSILAHELAHIQQFEAGELRGYNSWDAADMELSREKEEDADLRAAKLLGTTQGAIDFFKIQKYKNNRFIAGAFACGQLIIGIRAWNGYKKYGHWDRNYILRNIVIDGIYLGIFGYFQNPWSSHPSDTQRIAYLKEWEENKDRINKSEARPTALERFTEFTDKIKAKNISKK